MFSFSSVFAWQYAQGTVSRVWINGWTGSADVITFEIVPNPGYPVSISSFGVKTDATEANKNRILSILLMAQNSGSQIMVHYYPAAGSGPSMEVGDNTYQTYAI